MSNYFYQGLLLGFAYVAPLGIQNLYVINTAIHKKWKKALGVALVTTFFDISLALACFFGVGLLLDTFPILKGITLLLGSIVVIFMGFLIIRSQPQISNDINLDNHNLLEAIGICFAITWFNPQAIIDGSLLLGGFRTSLPQGMSDYFILGVCLASFIWFLSLTTIISTFRKNINLMVIKWLNMVCGLIIIFYGIRLGYSFFQLFT